MAKIDSIKLLEMLEDKIPQKEIAKHFGVSESAVSQRIKRLIPPPDLSHLTDKRRDFVLLVAEGKNPTEAAFNAFECKDRTSAKVMGCNLMKEPDITTGIKEVMDYVGLTRRYRIEKLKSHVDHKDPTVSLRALDQSFKLDGYVDRCISVSADYEALCRDIDEIEEEIFKLTGKHYGALKEDICSYDNYKSPQEEKHKAEAGNES